VTAPLAWKDAPWLVLDLETDGVDPETCNPCELGVVAFLDGEPVKSHSWLIKPPVPIPERATEIHGITNEMVEDAPTIEEVAREFLDWLPYGKVIAGYNALRYDFPILKRLVPGFYEACREPTILDPLVLVRFDDVGRYWKKKDNPDPTKGTHTLANAYQRSKLPPLEDGLEAHRTIPDCIMAGRLLWRWRSRLPDDGPAAQRAIVRARREQEERFQQWRRKKQAEEEAREDREYMDPPMSEGDCC